MKYTLYVTDACPGCDEAIAHLSDSGVAFEIVNLFDEDVNPPFRVLVAPALYLGEKLVGYGPDIPYRIPVPA